MKNDPLHLFDATGTSVMTRAHLEQRIEDLEAENRKLRALVVRQLKAREPKPQPITLN